MTTGKNGVDGKGQGAGSNVKPTDRGALFPAKEEPTTDKASFTDGQSVFKQRPFTTTSGNPSHAPLSNPTRKERRGSFSD